MKITKKRTAENGKSTTPKVSPNYKPEELTLQQWQVALRKQIAQKENFNIEQIDRKEHPGYYSVTNAISQRSYRVVFRGENSLWNYCSCMDYKTSQLGTCKHLEAVKIWIRKGRRKVCRTDPAYTSIYLCYKGERTVRLRIGTDNHEEFQELATPYFLPNGEMRPEAIDSIQTFLQAATLLNNTFRCYRDALSFILEKRDTQKRIHLLGNECLDTVLKSLLNIQLYPYQQEGIRFAFRAGRSIIADEMGLGKTIQAIGTAELMRKHGLVESILVVCPTSLKYQWKKEIERFTNVRAVVVEGNHLTRKALYQADEPYKIVSYNGLCNDINILGSMYTGLLVMDEVQRLKNWNTKIAKAARHIESDYTVILSGTPLENKLEELYAIMQIVDQYCLGPYYSFMDRTVEKSETGKVIGYKNLNAIGEKMKHVLIRRRKRDVALQLPERIDKVLFVPMTHVQREMHDECQVSVSKLVMKWNRHRFLSETDRRRLLLLMAQMRMLCDSTYILDQKTRHDTKVDETMNILNTIFESGDEKVVIFSQWERMTRLIAQELERIGVKYEYLHGGVPSESRKKLMDNFTEQPESRVFLSTDAGSTGLNLQVASVLINLDLPWNPAVLEQRIARIYRIGQKQNIQIINLVAGQTIEERMLSTLNFKSSLFEGILDNGEDAIFLEDNKFEKIMENINILSSVDKLRTTEDGSSVLLDDLEEQKKSGLQSKATDETIFTNTEDEYENFDTSPPRPKVGKETEESGLNRSIENPEQLVSQGISFLTGLAQTLRSPEGTRKLIDSIVEKDEKTGETVLRIPVADKESVVGMLNVLGKLLSGIK